MHQLLPAVLSSGRRDLDSSVETGVNSRIQPCEMSFSNSTDHRVSLWMSHKLRTKLPLNGTAKRTLIDLEEGTSKPDQFCPLPADHLLTLVYYNVLRALVSNTYSLGLDPDLMCDELLSPFPSEHPTQSLFRLPPDLLPTSLQKSQIHHPCIDIFPSAAARDNLLSAGDGFDDIDPWTDIIGKVQGSICWEQCCGNCNLRISS